MRAIIGIYLYVICFPKCKVTVKFSTPPVRSQRIVCSESKVHPGAVAFLFSTTRPSSFPSSASHTAYPATFGTSFSLLGFSHLGHWHKINEDTKKTQGSELEGVGGWGVKLLGCKIALAAVLLFQHFMASCSASVPTCLLSAFFPPPFFICFSVHTIPLLSSALVLCKL